MTTRVIGRPRAVRPGGYILIRRSRASFLVHGRAAVVASVLAALTIAVCVAYLCLGERYVAPAEVFNVLSGGPSRADFVVGELRLPRLVLGLLVGAAFGVGGALIQTVARNPLASPDIIGVSQGASALTIGALTFGVGSFSVLPYFSVAGGMIAAVVVYLFAWRRGMHAARFVLVGIGIAIALRSVVHLFITKGDYLAAHQAQVWIAGSLNGRGWDEAVPLGWTLLALVPGVVWAARAQRNAAFDDDTATALGVPLHRTRFGMALLGVFLASVATGAAGPVDFVALLAPQISRRLTCTAQIPLLCTALLGALIVVAADLPARLLFAPVELPVGVLTAAVGAPYLIWLIVRGPTGGRA